MDYLPLMLEVQQDSFQRDYGSRRRISVSYMIGAATEMLVTMCPSEEYQRGDFFATLTHGDNELKKRIEEWAKPRFDSVTIRDAEEF